MVEIQNYKKIIVEQTEKLGCVSTGYEWLVRFSKINDVNLDNFKKEFNLQERGRGINNFIAIKEAIIKKYPQIKIEIKYFKQKHEGGLEKLEFMKNLIREGVPCLVSISTPPCNWHIQPVVYFDDTRKLIGLYRYGSKFETEEKSYEHIINIHDNGFGGNDISWLDN